MKNETRKKSGETKKRSFYLAVGRRKTAVARVKLQVGGEGRILVNKLPIEEYFPGEAAKKIYLAPLQLIGNVGRFDIIITVRGSGKQGQLGAAVHGLARALTEVDPQYRPVLKKQGFLTRDARARERRKTGQAGRARAKKQSPKR